MHCTATKYLERYGILDTGWGTGSNDVANAFGTSVGSGALTLNQAILIAAIFEFLGAMVLGRVSTSTIAAGIADIKNLRVSHLPTPMV